MSSKEQEIKEDDDNISEEATKTKTNNNNNKMDDDEQPITNTCCDGSGDNVPNNSCMKGKIILITGANRGIGKAFVDTFLKYGVSKIYAGVRDIETAKNITFKDYNKGGIIKVIPIYIDMNNNNVDTIINASKQIENDGIRLDIVINNAGVLTETCTLDNDCIKNLQYEMNVNVYGLINLAKYFSPIIGRAAEKAEKSCDENENEIENENGNENGNGGIFVQVNSVASLRCAVPNVSTYSASKAASFSITQSLKNELWSKYGISVMSIHPGPIDTDMIKDVNGTSIFNNAPPPYIVAESLIDAIKNNSSRGSGSDSDSGNAKQQFPFMIYPDNKSKSLGKVYQSYAKIVHVEGNTYG